MENHGDHGDMPAANGAMEKHMQMMERQRLDTLWCHFANALLGFWLIGSPFIFGYTAIAADDFDLARLASELCLVQAAAMLVMMPYALDELVAMGQFLKDAMRRGKPFWRTFFTGDAMEGARHDATPEFEGSLSGMTLKALRGVNLPWGLFLVCAIGVWLMCSRLVFGTEGAMADSDHVVGALLITVSVLAMAEVARPLRLLNIPFGLWLIVAPWLVDGAGPGAASGSVIAGIAVVVLSLPRGRIFHRYAGWDRLLH